MRRSRLLSGVALALAFAAGCARPPERTPQSPPIPREEPRELEVPTARFLVRTNPVGGTLFLAGNFNGWNPGDRRFAFERTVELSNSVVWSLDVERALLKPAPVEFKFTRGSWATVETDGAFADVPNRGVAAQRLEDWPAEALLVLDFRVAAFLDQRPGGSEQAAASSGVVGRLERFELESERLANTRAVRVWLPTGYDAPENEARRYPVLYLQDGQNLFDGASAFTGVEWQVDETATRLVEEGRIPPLVVVGIDNAGLARAPEYNPPEASFPGGPGRGDRYVEFLEQELMPAVEERYRVATDADERALGGSSYGANITLYTAIHAPHLFGAVLLESPSVGFQDGVMLALAGEHAGDWPERVAIGVGTRELGSEQRTAGFVDAVLELEALLADAGLGPDRLLVTVEEGARHDEAAWARRLPAMLEFLLGD